MRNCWTSRNADCMLVKNVGLRENYWNNSQNYGILVVYANMRGNSSFLHNKGMKNGHF